MKRLVLILLALTLPSFAGTWALVQHPEKVNCTATTSVCTVTGASNIGAGHLLVISMMFTQTAGPVTGQSVTDGTNTYVHCPANACVATGTIRGTDFFYVLSTAAVTSPSIVVTLSAASSGTWEVGVTEYSTTGTAIFDAGNNASSAACSSCVGPALTLTGTNDVVIQIIRGNTPTAISGASYTNPADFGSLAAVGGAININSGAAQTWTMTSSTAGMAAIAFKDAASVRRPKNSGWR